MGGTQAVQNPQVLGLHGGQLLRRAFPQPAAERPILLVSLLLEVNMASEAGYSPGQLLLCLSSSGLQLLLILLTLQLKLLHTLPQSLVLLQHL